MKYFPVFTNRDPIPQDYTVGLFALEANSPGFKKSHPTLPKSFSSIFTMTANLRSTRVNTEIIETQGSLTGDSSSKTTQIVKPKTPVVPHSALAFSQNKKQMEKQIQKVDQQKRAPAARSQVKNSTGIYS